MKVKWIGKSSAQTSISPKSTNIKNVVDLENLFPHRIDVAKHWFKYLKTYDGKKANRLFFNEDVLGVDKSLQIIDENYEYWKELREVKQKRNLSDDYSQKLLQKYKDFHMEDS